MRGEHVHSCPWSVILMGSPPHARGALIHRPDRRLSNGITPACAGSTKSSKAYHCQHEDHPRMRGEHSNAVRMSASVTGSPPHARGAPRRTEKTIHNSRITPACAGSTSVRLWSGFWTWDHPRMRGEHSGQTDWLPLGVGSPPHARGARAVAGFDEVNLGITPACAGSTH